MIAGGDNILVSAYRAAFGSVMESAHQAEEKAKQDRKARTGFEDGPLARTLAEIFRRDVLQETGKRTAVAGVVIGATAACGPVCGGVVAAAACSGQTFTNPQHDTGPTTDGGDGGQRTDMPAPSRTDSDQDSIPDRQDNCVNVRNTYQADWNHDRVGDACDDSDGDGWLDGCPDNCVDAMTMTGYGRVDRNGNLRDCVVGQFDTNGDGFPDGCSFGEGYDSDGNGTLDSCAIPAFHPDNCRDVANPDQSDIDGDHIGDACDTEHYGRKDLAGSLTLLGVPNTVYNFQRSGGNLYGVSVDPENQIVSCSLLTASDLSPAGDITGSMRCLSVAEVTRPAVCARPGMGTETYCDLSLHPRPKNLAVIDSNGDGDPERFAVLQDISSCALDVDPDCDVWETASLLAAEIPIIDAATGVRIDQQGDLRGEIPAYNSGGGPITFPAPRGLQTSVWYNNILYAGVRNSLLPGDVPPGFVSYVVPYGIVDGVAADGTPYTGLGYADTPFLASTAAGDRPDPPNDRDMTAMGLVGGGRYLVMMNRLDGPDGDAVDPDDTPSLQLFDIQNIDDLGRPASIRKIQLAEGEMQRFPQLTLSPGCSDESLSGCSAIVADALAPQLYRADLTGVAPLETIPLRDGVSGTITGTGMFGTGSLVDNVVVAIESGGNIVFFDRADERVRFVPAGHEPTALYVDRGLKLMYVAVRDPIIGDPDPMRSNPGISVFRYPRIFDPPLVVHQICPAPPPIEGGGTGSGADGGN